MPSSWAQGIISRTAPRATRCWVRKMSRDSCKTVLQVKSLFCPVPLPFGCIPAPSLAGGQWSRRMRLCPFQYMAGVKHPCHANTNPGKAWLCESMQGDLEGPLYPRTILSSRLMSGPKKGLCFRLIRLPVCPGYSNLRAIRFTQHDSLVILSPRPGSGLPQSDPGGQGR
jgi:hypothetical protein